MNSFTCSVCKRTSYNPNDVAAQYCGACKEFEADRVAEKPPLGIVPRWIWIEHRMRDIHEGVERFRSAGKDIPHEWVSELTWLDSEHTRAITEWRDRNKRGGFGPKKP